MSMPVPSRRRGPARPVALAVLAALLVPLLLAGCTTRRPAVRTDAGRPPAPAVPAVVAPAAAATEPAAAVPADPAPSPPAADAPAADEGEQVYAQALRLLADGELDHAEDLLHVLQDQLGATVPPRGDGERNRSLARRVRLLSGLLAEAMSLAGPDSLAADSLLASGYDRAAGLGLPDSLLPVTGPQRPALQADLLRTDNAAVRRWLAYFEGPGRRQMERWLRRRSEVDSLVTSVLDEAGLPRELIYLAMIESGLSPHARSPVGAVGAWQFMPGTARLFSLRRDWWVDERRDLELSTRAAARYLRRLHDEFGDWGLVLAAYNSGEGRIRRAVALAGHDDFWRLRLPAQTSDYVPKFIAAARIGEDPAAFGFEPEPQPSLGYDVVPVDDATDLALVARCAGVDEQAVIALNPGLLRRASPPDSPGYPVRVPAGTGRRCLAELKRVPAEERLTWRRHRVERGETLSGIARSYGTTATDIAALNGVRNPRLIRPGDQLLIPMPAVLARKASARAVERGHYVPPEGYQRVAYRVQKGDTLSGIARKLGVSLTHLRKVNNLHHTSLIKPGQRLFAYVAGSG